MASLAVLAASVAVGGVAYTQAVAADRGGNGQAVAKATVNAAPAVARPPLTLNPGDKAIFLGDSWTFGQHIPDYKQGFAYLTINKLGLDGQVLGYPGSGFINPNKRNEGTFAQRIEALPTSDIKMIVIQGGTNDRDQDHLALTEAVVKTVETANRKFPGAQVVLLGPLSPGYPKDPRITIVHGPCHRARHGGRSRTASRQANR